MLLQETCKTVQADRAFIVALVEHGVIKPAGASQADWDFDWQQLQRCRRARQLQRDYGIKVGAIGLSLDIVDALHRLRRQLL